MKNCVVIQNINVTETHWAQTVMKMPLSVLKKQQEPLQLLFSGKQTFCLTTEKAFRAEINKYWNKQVSVWCLEDVYDRRRTQWGRYWSPATLNDCQAYILWLMAWHRVQWVFAKSSCVPWNVFFWWIFVKDKSFLKIWLLQEFSKLKTSGAGKICFL